MTHRAILGHFVLFQVILSYFGPFYYFRPCFKISGYIKLFWGIMDYLRLFWAKNVTDGQTYIYIQFHKYLSSMIFFTTPHDNILLYFHCLFEITPPASHKTSLNNSPCIYFSDILITNNSPCAIIAKFLFMVGEVFVRLGGRRVVDE